MIYKHEIKNTYTTVTDKFVKSTFFGNNNVPYNLLIFILWPFLSFLISVFNFSDKSLRKFILAFLVLFGATGVLSNKTHDALGHMRYFDEIARRPLSDLWIIVTDLFTGGKAPVTDLYATFVNFFISRLTDNASYMFAFHALIFGIFYLKSTSLLYDEFRGNKNINTFLFLLLFVFIIPIDKIQYVRFWTAAWIFIYATLKLLKNKNIKHFILLFLACFVHISFILPVAIALIYFVVGNRINIYFIILLISYILPGLITSQISQFGSLGAGELLDNKVSAYALNETYIADRVARFEVRSWYIRFQVPFLHYALLFVLSYLYIKRKKFIQDNYQLSLFSFLVLFLAFVNFGYQIASVGERFILLFFSFGCVFLYRHFSLNDKKQLSWLTYILIIPSSLWLLVQLRFMLDFMNAFMIVGNPLFFLFEDTNITLLDLK